MIASFFFSHISNSSIRSSLTCTRKIWSFSKRSTFLELEVPQATLPSKKLKSQKNLTSWSFRILMKILFLETPTAWSFWAKRSQRREFIATFAKSSTVTRPRIVQRKALEWTKSRRRKRRKFESFRRQDSTAIIVKVRWFLLLKKLKFLRKIFSFYFRIRFAWHGELPQQRRGNILRPFWHHNVSCFFFCFFS